MYKALSYGGVERAVTYCLQFIPRQLYLDPSLEDNLYSYQLEHRSISFQSLYMTLAGEPFTISSNFTLATEVEAQTFARALEMVHCSGGSRAIKIMLFSPHLAEDEEARREKASVPGYPIQSKHEYGGTILLLDSFYIWFALGSGSCTTLFMLLSRSKIPVWRELSPSLQNRYRNSLMWPCLSKGVYARRYLSATKLWRFSFLNLHIVSTTMDTLYVFHGRCVGLYLPVLLSL